MGADEKPVDPHYQKYHDHKMPDTLNNGPIEERSCKDIICCIIFVLFIAGMVVVTILGFSQGNPDIVIYPYDEDGRQCGKTNVTAAYPYLYFYNSVSNIQTFNASKITQGVCVKTCPSVYTGTLDCYPTANNPNCAISSTNFYKSVSCTNSTSNSTSNSTTNSTSSNSTDANSTSSNTTTNTTSNNVNNLISLQFLNTDKLISWLSDLGTTYPILLASAGYSLIIALFYLLLVRCCAGVIAYTTIFLILGCLAGLGYLFQARIDYYKNLSDDTYVLAMKVLCGLFYGLAGIWLLIILFMCNKIRLAIALVKCTARFVGSTCSVFIIPLIFYVVSVCFYAYWVVLSIYLYSSGTVSPGSSGFFVNIQWNTTTRYAWWYHLFALLYINAFLNAFNQFVLASSACIWYFEQSNPDGARGPVRRSYYRAFRYHLGSLAFGSLIIAIIRFMMVVLEYIKRKIELAGPQKSGCYKCVISCCQCFLGCMARLMEFINRHAYIQIALKGDSFCVAAWEGFGLIVRNLGRWSTLFLIGGVFNIIGKLFISAVTGLIGYLLITRIADFNDKLNSPILPVTVMVLIGWIVGSITMSIYGMSGDALLHCFILDEELNNKLVKHSPEELRTFIQDERD